MGWEDGPLLGLDFETTGIDPTSDSPVQVAIVTTTPDEVTSREVFIVDPGREIPEGAVAVHGITTERAHREGRCLEEAARRVHAALVQAVAEAVPVVAMNASFDLTLADTLFRSFGLRRLEWRAVLDPLVLDRHLDRYRKGKRRLDALCEHYCVPLVRAHDAGSDAAAAVGLTRQIARFYPSCARTPAERLTKLQARWHREWAEHYDEWRRSQQMAGLEPEEFAWPLRRPQPPLRSVSAGLSAGIPAGVPAGGAAGVAAGLASTAGGAGSAGGPGSGVGGVEGVEHRVDVLLGAARVHDGKADHGLTLVSRRHDEGRARLQQLF
jgi:DNA polymerase-3 subunit epsilon